MPLYVTLCRRWASLVALSLPVMCANSLIVFIVLCWHAYRMNRVMTTLLKLCVAVICLLALLSAGRALRQTVDIAVPSAAQISASAGSLNTRTERALRALGEGME